MSLSADERWLTAARARAASGQWERDADAVYADLQQQVREARGEGPVLPGCPACGSHPEMREFPRYELVSKDPFLYCQVCYGFWAVGDALERGVADPVFIHPALHVVQAPRRCRACFGHLKPDNTCAKCGATPGLLACPLCGESMKRVERKGVHVDQCRRCDGTWFDTGEIVTAYHLEPAQGLAMSTIDEHATDDVPPPWILAAQVLSRMFLPFLPF